MEIGTMRLTNIVWTTAIIAAAILLTAVLSTASLQADGAGGAGPVGKAEQVARGKYLVDIMGCHDCHTPTKMGANGPEWDMTRALSGHPEDHVMPPAPAPRGPWIAAIADTFTAFASPAGTVSTPNLTPDKETGLGDWTVEE